MNRIFDITLKDLTQILRNRKTFLFLLIMPIGFTLLFGLAFGGSGKAEPTRACRSATWTRMAAPSAQTLKDLLANFHRHPPGRRPQAAAKRTSNSWSADEKLAAALVIPAGYSQSVQSGTPAEIGFHRRPVPDLHRHRPESEILAAANRSDERRPHRQHRCKDDRRPVRLRPGPRHRPWLPGRTHPSRCRSPPAYPPNRRTRTSCPLAHSSPGMMLQFAIAGLLTAATVIVNERKTRSLQRLLTTATSRVQILLGHYLAIFTLIFGQFLLLIVFGQLS